MLDKSSAMNAEQRQNKRQDMKCSNCKNPVDATSIHCEWCGAKIVRQKEQTTHELNIVANGTYTDFMAQIQQLDKQSTGTGTVFGALKNVLYKSKGDVVRQKANFIKTYPLSNNNLEDVLQIATLAVRSFEEIKISSWSDSSNEQDRKKLIKEAWKVKAEESISILETYGKDTFIKEQTEKLRAIITQKKGILNKLFGK